MESIEAKLWMYIDGVLSPQETEAIKIQIQNDPKTAYLFQELKSIADNLREMETDEPSMSFTRNVMEKVQTEIAPVVLKTNIDKRVIYSISGLFIASILALLGYVFMHASVDLQSDNSWFRMPEIKAFKSGPFLTAFLMADIILALVYLDSVLRNTLLANRRKSADT